MKETLKRIIADFHDRPLPDFVLREKAIHWNTGLICTVVGPRRAGKTFFLYQMMADLMKKGVSKDHIVYLNFEDERLDWSGNHDAVFEAYLELYPDTDLGAVYFFFDEIQQAPKWDKFIRRVLDSVSKNLFVTGSNAATLSRDIATALRGRQYVVEILPLSFSEYLACKEIDKADRFSTAGASRINTAFDGFMAFGGYPAIVNFEDLLKIETLQNYYETVVFKDLAERYEIRRIDILKYLLKRMTASYTKEFSLHKIYNDMKSMGFSVGKDTVYSLFEMASSVYFAAIVEQYEASVAKRRRSNKKIYLYDHGFAAALNYSLSKDHGKQFENIIYVELVRRGYDIYYVKNGFECDFYCLDKQGRTLALQACYDLNGENIGRELKGLERAQADEKLLLYQHRRGPVPGKDFECLPFLEWVLGGG